MEAKRSSTPPPVNPPFTVEITFDNWEEFSDTVRDLAANCRNGLAYQLWDTLDDVEHLGKPR